MPLGASTRDHQKSKISFEPVTFADVPHWHADDALAAFEAFASTAERVLQHSDVKNSSRPTDGLIAACKAALDLNVTALSVDQARAFFEGTFHPHRVVHDQPEGLLTGYYEPELAGSWTKTGPYVFPVYRRPPDLENVVAESERGACAHALTHVRRLPNGETEPYATREEIECGALDGHGLDLLYLRDPVDCFFMHIQGSGLIKFDDGSHVRVTYDGKNGRPYTSVGRVLIDAGHISETDMSLAALKAWLAADRERGRKAMWHNTSFVFFRTLDGDEGKSALGAQNIPLIPGRSLAVDTAYHALGTPVFVTAPTLQDSDHGTPGFNRLMIASDVGSAIRGPERGDIYYGSGADAGARAGVTKHPGNFIIFMPKADIA